MRPIIALTLVAALAAVPACSASPPDDSAADAARSASAAPSVPPVGEASQSSGPIATPAAADPLLSYPLTDVATGESFTLGELAVDRPVLVETMAIWCSTCRAQQREVVAAHAQADFHSVGIDVDPNERAADLAAYAVAEGFDWLFAMADLGLVQALTDRYGFAVTNPPSTPTFVVSTDGSIRALEFGRVRSAEELITELGAG